MQKVLRRIRGAVGTGLTWAVAWAVAGLLIGAASLLVPGLPWDSFFEIFDAPLPALAVPGFFGGVFFSAVLGIAGRRRRFRDLSLPRFAAWGAAGGVLLTLFPFALVAVGLASTEGSAHGAWDVIRVIGGPFVLLSTLSATGSLLLARRAERRAALDGDEEVVSDTSLTDGESPELLTGGVPPFHGHPSSRAREHVRAKPASGSSDA